MNKNNYLVNFINKIDLIINRIIKKNLNRLSTFSIHKILKSNKFFLSLAFSIVLSLSYLLLPSFYDKNEINLKLNKELEKKLNLNFKFNENFTYNFIPRPHFIYKNSSIIKDNNEISKIKKLKVFISLKNFFSYKNFDVQNLIIEKSNFNLNNQNYDFFVKLLDSDFKDGKLTIKNSNIFFKNKDEEVLFINKILDLKYFYDQKFLKNKIKLKSEIFNLPYELELNKNDIEKKIFTVLNLGFSKLNIENELDFSNEVKKGSTNFKLGKNKFSGTYDIYKNNFYFNLFDDLQNPNFTYKGEANFDPFYSKLEGSVKGINILYLINSNNLILQLLKTEILNNKNLNFELNIHGNKIKDFSDFADIKLNLKIREGLIDIDDTEFYWKNNLNFFLKDSLIYVKDGELILDGKLNLNFKNYNEIYKFLITPKKYRKELTNIKADFVYNFDQKIVNFDNILINNKRNKELNQILERLTFKKTKIQNKVYIKNILNRALKSYAG